MPHLQPDEALAMGLLPGFERFGTQNLMSRLAALGIGQPGPMGARGGALFARPGISLRPSFAQPANLQALLSPFGFQRAVPGAEVPVGPRAPEVTRRPFSFGTALGRGELLPGRAVGFGQGAAERGLLSLNPGVLRALVMNPDFRLPTGMRLTAEAQRSLAGAPQLIAQYQQLIRDGFGSTTPVTAEQAAILAAAGLDANLTGNPQDPANPFQFIVQGPQRPAQPAVTPEPVGTSLVPPTVPGTTEPIAAPEVTAPAATSPVAVGAAPPGSYGLEAQAAPPATFVDVSAPSGAGSAPGPDAGAAPGPGPDAGAAPGPGPDTGAAPGPDAGSAPGPDAGSAPGPDAGSPDGGGDGGGVGAFHHGSQVPKEGWYFLEDGEFVLNRDAYGRMKPLIDEINKIGKGAGETAVTRIQAAATKVAAGLRQKNLEDSAAPQGAAPGRAPTVGFFGGPFGEQEIAEEPRNGKPADRIQTLPYNTQEFEKPGRGPFEYPVPSTPDQLRDMLSPPATEPMVGPRRFHEGGEIPAPGPTRAQGIVPPWLQEVGRGNAGPMLAEVGKQELATNLPAMTTTKFPPLGRNAYADPTGRITFESKNPDPSTWMRLETSPTTVRSLLDSGEANQERPLLVPPGTLDLPPRARGRVIGTAYKSQYASTRPMLDERTDELGLQDIGRQAMRGGLPLPQVGVGAPSVNPLSRASVARGLPMMTP